MKKLSWKQIIGGVMAFLMVLTQAPVAALAVTDAPAPTAHASQYGSSVETPIYAKGREGSGSELLGKAQMETVVRFEIDPEVSVLVTQESEDPEAEPVTETVHPYHDWRVAFVVSFNRNVAKDSLGISTNCSYAANWGMNGWCGFLLPKDLQAGQELQLLGSGGQNLTYGELCAYIPSFLSGAFNLDEENIGVKATFKLKLYEKKDGSETGNTVTLASYSFAFSKAKNPFGDSQQEPAATEIPEEPGTSVALVEETETDENGVPADNDLPGDVTEKNSEGTDDVTDEEPTKGSASDGELETDENDFETDSTGTDGGADSTGGNNAETDDEIGDDSEGTVDGTEEEKPNGNTSNGEIATNENGSENDNTGIDGGADIIAGNNGETNDETGDDSEGTVDETEEEKPNGAEDGGTEDEGELNNQSGDGTEGLTDEVDREPNRDNLTGSDSTWTIELTSRTENSTTTVARVSGGGDYADGETVTVIAYPRNGYRFVGWYEQSDTSFSNILCYDQAYTFVVAENRSLMAVYTVASGASFMLTVYGSKFKVNNGSQQTEISSQKLTPGDRVFLSFTDTSKTFLYWVNKPGRILSTDKDYSFVMVGDTEVYACYSQAAESTTTALVIFRNASNQVLLSRSYTQNETIQYPEKIPSMMGYIFTGWYIADVNGVASGTEATQENIWAAMESGNSVTVVPGYVSSGNTYTALVTYIDESGTELQSGITDTNTVGKSKVYTAPAQIGEKNFLYWKLNHEIVGYAQDYTLLRAMPGTVTLEACYGDTAGEPEALVTITQTYSKKKADGNYALSNTMQYFVPEEYEVAEAGFVYGTDTARFGGENGQENLEIGKQGVLQHDSGYRYNRAIYTLNYAAYDPSVILYARAYVIFKDRAGLNVYTIYSDMTTCQYVFESGFLVVFQNWDGSVLQQGTVPNGATPVYAGETPTKAATAQYTYTFAGWSPAITTVAADTTYTATYTQTVNKYTITFVDEDGTTVLDTQALDYGATPVYAGETPTKAATAQYTYTFAGWSPAITTVAADTTYTATYTETVNKYTVTFVDEDGTVLLAAAEYDYGTAAADIVKPADPTKASTAQYTYTFDKWTPEIAEVTGNATYTATYTSTVNEYTIMWVDGDGNTLKTEQVAYGATLEVTAPEAPTKAHHEFAGWDRDIPATMPAENITITANWTPLTEYFIVGTFTDPAWADGIDHGAIQLTQNPSSETEWMADVNFAVNDGIKVVKTVGGNANAWYPDGMNNEYPVDQAHSGEAVMYFKETYDSGWNDFGGYFWISKAHSITMVTDPADVGSFTVRMNNDQGDEVTTSTQGTTLYVDVTVPDGYAISAIQWFDTNAQTPTMNDIATSGNDAFKFTMPDYDVTVKVTYEAAQSKFVITSNFVNVDSYLYRVGNGNTVALSSLFEAADGETINSADVQVTVYALNDQTTVSRAFTRSTNTLANCTYNANTTNWKNGTLQFTGEGPVQVAIKEGDNGTECLLNLEVIDGKNATAAANATDNNVVLLQDISISGAPSITINNGYALYGNGFTITCTGDGSTAGYTGMGTGYILVTGNGLLDNVQVIAPDFPKAYLYTGSTSYDYYVSEDTNKVGGSSSTRYGYQLSAVKTSGVATITNSYVQGARNNVLADGGSLTIKNCVFSNGSLSNIFFNSNSGTLNLKNVTTKQYRRQFAYQLSGQQANNADVVGFGILVGPTPEYGVTVSSNPTINIDGYLNQRNWVCADDKNITSSQIASSLINKAVTQSNFQHTMNDTTYVNLGIVYLNTASIVINDNRTNHGYVSASVSMSGVQGQVYAPGRNTQTVEPASPSDQYEATQQGVALPLLTYVDEAENITLTRETVYDYTFTATLNAGESYTFDFSKLYVMLHGEDTTYTIRDSNNNSVAANSTVTLSTAGTTRYTIEVVSDSCYDPFGNVQLLFEDETFVINLALVADIASLPEPTIVQNPYGTKYKVTASNSTSADWTAALVPLDGLKIKYWSTAQNREVTIDLSSVSISGSNQVGNEITINGPDYTLTLYCTNIHSTKGKNTWVNAKDSSNNYKLYVTAAEDCRVSSKTSSVGPKVTYTFTDNLYKSVSITSMDYTTSKPASGDTLYSHAKLLNGELTTSFGSTSCVAAGTLVTMANGTQKPVESLLENDQVLAFDHETGEYVATPLFMVVNHGHKVYDVIHLTFSDGSDLKIIESHGLFDLDLRQYVDITDANYLDLIGHRFASYKNGVTKPVTLVSAEIIQEETDMMAAFSYGNLNAITNGLVSYDTKLFGTYNYFEYDADMKYVEDAKRADVEQYGLYVYEDWSDYIDRDTFDAFGFQYFKVSEGKGLCTRDDLIGYILWLGDLIEEGCIPVSKYLFR